MKCETEVFSTVLTQSIQGTSRTLKERERERMIFSRDAQHGVIIPIHPVSGFPKQFTHRKYTSTYRSSSLLLYEVRCFGRYPCLLHEFDTRQKAMVRLEKDLRTLFPELEKMVSTIDYCNIKKHLLHPQPPSNAIERCRFTRRNWNN